MPRLRSTVIVGVAASDAHAVANILITESLRNNGYLVVNLGVCTPLREFADAQAAHSEAIAVVIGSVNGHAYDDLADLPALRLDGLLHCPVVLGGNLSVGSTKSSKDITRLSLLGVDHILDSVHDLLPLLDSLARKTAQVSA
ncbi:methylaspartate mutase sigma subunit [Saccharothrix ecbatanensis]|jgi:methylaspartate mutase sigma subunit|uniref:Methylaspartate mutase sigma subunit n=1 Tax=Saccharothrix ecbatanensis TaxID=1105145 RepID=A0A7W9HJ27_9PSEU|nr:methylaspartate mutase [Saccharothrix ecbatanensis]MBB5803130.1 methylaspartate mutase sigma subunit [Saccharothrix ecbatanensis]